MTKNETDFMTYTDGTFFCVCVCVCIMFIVRFDSYLFSEHGARGGAAAAAV